MRAKGLSSSYGYLQLAEFCLEHDRPKDALKFAEEGLWIFEDDRPDQRLLIFTSQLLAKMGRASDAESHLWRAFEKAPTLALYERLRKIGGEAAHRRALQLLEALCHRKRSVGWQNPADLLVKILLQENAHDQAWQTFRKFGAAPSTHEQLVRATEKTHSGEAIAFYTASIEHLVGHGDYEQAVELIARLAELRPAGEQTRIFSLSRCATAASAAS